MPATPTPLPVGQRGGGDWPRRRQRGAGARTRPPQPHLRPVVQEGGDQMAPPEGPRGKRRAAAPTTPAPRRPGTRGAGGPAEGGAEEESRRRDRRASAPAPARPGEAGPAENCVEERARGQLMLDLVSKNGNRDSKTHRFSSLPPPLLIVASSLFNGGCGGCTPAGGGRQILRVAVRVGEHGRT